MCQHESAKQIANQNGVVIFECIKCNILFAKPFGEIILVTEVTCPYCEGDGESANCTMCYCDGTMYIEPVAI